ncbi:hypothetical protein B0J17DRAFT_636517 [Rhizoctonia solani]|nr:hypothetical protein B0J17DRAFT_636517 [Rhizoctonia solani]
MKVSPERAGSILLKRNEAYHSELLAVRWFKVTQRSLRFNMCNLEISTQLDDGTPDIHDQLQMEFGQSCSIPMNRASPLQWR